MQVVHKNNKPASTEHQFQLPEPIAPMSWFHVRVAITRQPALQFHVKVWPDGKPQPTNWQSIVSDTGNIKGVPLIPVGYGIQATGCNVYLDDLQIIQVK